MLRRGVLLQLPTSDVVVRQEQAVGADERTRAAVIHAHAREPQMIQPLLRRMEIVLRRQLLQWRVIKGPHSLFCAHERRNHKERDHKKHKNRTHLLKHRNPHLGGRFRIQQNPKPKPEQSYSGRGF